MADHCEVGQGWRGAGWGKGGRGGEAGKSYQLRTALPDFGLKVADNLD
jgi:hypothetical protein